MGRHAVDELPQEEAVVLEEGREGLGEGGGGLSVRGLHHVEDEAGGLLAVSARHVSPGVAHQHDVEGDAHAADELHRLADRVRAHVPAARDVGPVLRVGVCDRIREQHHAQVGAAGVLGGHGLRPYEGVVEVRPLPFVAVARDVVDGDLVLAPEEDQPVAMAPQECEHLLERGHPLLVGVEGRQRGGVVHQKEDDGALARGRRGGGAYARQRGTHLERESKQGGQHRRPPILTPCGDVAGGLPRWARPPRV